MITCREIKLALAAMVATLCMGAVAGQAPVQHSAVFDWNSFVATPTNVGSVRPVFRGPTTTLDELEIHVTTLNPGETSHAPHQHFNEELVIVKEGTVETLSNGQWKKATPGSIIFNASNETHGLRNVGTTPATYHVINWKTASTAQSQPQK